MQLRQQSFCACTRGPIETQSTIPEWHGGKEMRFLRPKNLLPVLLVLSSGKGQDGFSGSAFRFSSTTTAMRTPRVTESAPEGRLFCMSTCDGSSRRLSQML